MTLKLWLAFVAASAVLLVTPGPTILTVIGYSVSHGRRARAALIAAVALGDSTALAVSLLGLGAVLGYLLAGVAIGPVGLALVSDPAAILPWCGKDASEAYRTKTRGRPHSPYADTLLPKYRIGALTAK